MSENLGGLDMGAEPEESDEGMTPSDPADKTSEPLLGDHTSSSSSTSPESEQEPIVTTSPPQPQTWKAHRVFKQAVTDFTNIKEHAKGVVERITGAPPSSFKMLSSTDAPSGKWIKELSSMANVVVGRCARVLLLRPEELKENFEEEAPASAKDASRYARNFLEYCCFRALAVGTQVSDHLRDKDFRRWTFDMMLAWDAPGAISQPSGQMDAESSASLEAFARLAPGIPLVADSVTVHALFELLTEDTNNRMPFATYNKYLTELEKTVKYIKGLTSGAVASALGIVRGEESVVETDGGTPTQPVLQHIGVTAWPGRVTLTDQALYFEPSGVVSYDAAKKYDLSADLRHQVRPDLVGPWGAKIFDKAIMYKNSVIQDPVVLEFSELTGHMRRDYWLAIIKEIVAVHSFARQNRLEGPARRQALAKAVRGIARLKTLWALNKTLPPNPEMHLTFLCADELPGGDAILRAMATNLRLGDGTSPPGPAKREQLEVLGDLVGAATGFSTRSSADGGQGHGHAGASSSGGTQALGAMLSAPAMKTQSRGSAAAAAVAALLPPGSLVSPGTASKETGGVMPVGDVLVGEMTPLEKAVKSSRESSKKVAKAKRTVDEVKVEGMGPNVALLKELLMPMLVLSEWLTSLAQWEEPIKTCAFLLCSLYIIYKDWLCYVIPFLLLFNALVMMWLRFAQQSRSSLRAASRKRRNEVVVVTPPNKNAVEQILVIQQAVAQVESTIQAINISLLKLRALEMSELPQATDELILAHVGLAILLACLPFRIVVLVVLLEFFTRSLEFRREQTERIMRRFREWWHRIPVVPVRFMEEDNTKDDLY